MIRIAIVAGSTRPSRRARLVAEWVAKVAARDDTVTTGAAMFEIVDLVDYRLPLLDEPAPAAIGDYSRDHTRSWAEKIASFDGFVFVTPEYNHSMPAALKNAIDFLFSEWNDKAAGFVSYGLNDGVRAVEALRLSLAEVKIACVRSQVALSLFGDFIITDMTEPGQLAPREHHEALCHRMLGELTTWARALTPLREHTSTPAPM
ncbi:MAG: NADPH-dependent FMN reductase [Sciscionella sp.]